MMKNKILIFLSLAIFVASVSESYDLNEGAQKTKKKILQLFNENHSDCAKWIIVRQCTPSPGRYRHPAICNPEDSYEKLVCQK